MLTQIKSMYRLTGVIKPELYRRRKAFFSRCDHIDFFNVPIFIISFNRLTYLEGLVNRFRKMGYTNINIIDNHSTYPPLLDYYKKTDCKVFKLSKNYGHMAFWECDRFNCFREDLYVVTDPDIMPVEECPNDFVEQLYKCLKRHPKLKKAGLSLKIDDIPAEIPLHDEIIKWEKKYNNIRILGLNYCVADVDTTLALYIPDSLDISGNFLSAVRLGYPYQARHLPWYKIKADITEEDFYYARTRTTGFWDETEGKARVDTSENN